VYLVAEEPLQPANTAVTVYWKNGKVAVTDGPYAETKEQLGGIQVLEARDLNHAIQLISQCPGVKLKCGTIEIRPAADINEIMRESERRRRKDTSRWGRPRGKEWSGSWPGAGLVAILFFSWLGQAAAGARTASRHQRNVP